MATYRLPSHPERHIGFGLVWRRLLSTKVLATQLLSTDQRSSKRWATSSVDDLVGRQLNYSSGRFLYLFAGYHRHCP